MTSTRMNFKQKIEQTIEDKYIIAQMLDKEQEKGFDDLMNVYYEGAGSEFLLEMFKKESLLLTAYLKIAEEKEEYELCHKIAFIIRVNYENIVKIFSELFTEEDLNIIKKWHEYCQDEVNNRNYD